MITASAVERPSRAYRDIRNLRAVQMPLGHSSVATTERYCAVDDFEIRAAKEAASAGTETNSAPSPTGG